MMAIKNPIKMKKIVAAFDGLKYSPGTALYSVYLAKEADAHLVGIFLDDFTYHSHQLTSQNYQKLLKERKKLEVADKTVREAAAVLFGKACQEAGLNYTLHHDRSIAMQELLHESIYADVVIIDKKETFNRYEKDIPACFIRDLLANAECPVLIVPTKFKPVKKIILLYDGTPASVYAIKMFSYLFPSMKRLPTEVVSVRDDTINIHLPENHLMKEFMKRHFPKATYQVMNGDAETEIVHYLKNRTQDELLVLGAYHRSMVSRWFKTSMADKLMRDLRTPLFIAHNK
jgi:hypothetical protein